MFRLVVWVWRYLGLNTGGIEGKKGQTVGSNNSRTRHGFVMRHGALDSPWHGASNGVCDIGVGDVIVAVGCHRVAMD